MFKAKIILLLILASFVLARPVQSPVQPYIQPPVKQFVVVTEENLLLKVNEQRVLHGVAPMKFDNRLHLSAQMKAAEMIREGQQPNPHLNASGVEGYLKIKDFASECNYMSENLITYPGDVRVSTDLAVKAWLDSPSHKAAMLDTEMDLVGYSIMGKYIVQHMCKL